MYPHEYYCWPEYPSVENFYFVNIPKNCTTTVLNWASYIKTRDGYLDKPFRFTILREPYGRLKSTFAYGLGQRYAYRETVESIGKKLISSQQLEGDLLTHFIPQHVYLEHSPVKIDHYYHTGQMRELRKDLSSRSGLQIKWLQENRSRYSPQFKAQYHEWFIENKMWIDDFLDKDLELFYTASFKS